MNKPTLILAAGLLAATSLPSLAGDRDEVVGLLVGATTGGAIGYHVGGHDGAAVGALLGAAVGVSVADNDHRHVRRGYYRAEPDVVYVRERRQPPQYIYVSERPRYYGYDDRGYRDRGYRGRHHRHRDRDHRHDHHCDD